MKLIKIALGLLLPFWLVHAYRLAPGRVRGSRFWPGSQGPSSSHMALDLMDRGVPGWEAVGRALAGNGHPIVPKWEHWD